MSAPPLELELRAMRPTDRNFVLSSWLRSYAARGRDAYDYPAAADFFADYAPVVLALMARSSVVIAALSAEPDVVVGWMAVEGDTLHYVLVKPRFRRCGVARWMLEDFAALPVVYTHRTSDAMRCPVPEGWSYRRFRIWKEAA